MAEPLFSPFSKPIYVMVKPAGPACNLACEYCYYLEKSALVKEDGSGSLMSNELLERFVRDYITSQVDRRVLFTWHGGEPLLRPLSFYRRAVELQKKYAGGRQVDNCIQTNGTLLTDEWCEFLRENNFLVGISVDGGALFHDTFRRDKQGRPTFERVMRSIEMLRRHGVEYNAMAVVNRLNADYPEDFYRFFKQMDCRYIQFAPIVEPMRDPATGRMTVIPSSVSPQQWGEFLCRLFDEWVKEDVGKFFIRHFDDVLANWVGVTPGLCILAKTCGQAGVMEHNGDVYSCDHFVFPEYKLGNIRNKTLTEMMWSPKQFRFGQSKQTSLPRQCKRCRYLRICNGECPKNRLSQSVDGEPGLNYLCEGYYRFFEHTAPFMERMAREILAENGNGNGNSGNGGK